MLLEKFIEILLEDYILADLYVMFSFNETFVQYIVVIDTGFVKIIFLLKSVLVDFAFNVVILNDRDLVLDLSLKLLLILKSIYYLLHLFLF